MRLFYEQIVGATNKWIKQTLYPKFHKFAIYLLNIGCLLKGFSQNPIYLFVILSFAPLALGASTNANRLDLHTWKQ